MKIYQYTDDTEWFEGAMYFFNINNSVLSSRTGKVVDETPSNKDTLIYVGDL